MDNIRQIAECIFYKTNYSIDLCDYTIRTPSIFGNMYLATLYEDRDTGSAILASYYSEEKLQELLSYFRYTVLIRFPNGCFVRLEEFRYEFGEVFKANKS